MHNAMQGITILYIVVVRTTASNISKIIICLLQSYKLHCAYWITSMMLGNEIMKTAEQVLL